MYNHYHYLRLHTIEIKPTDKQWLIGLPSRNGTISLNPSAFKLSEISMAIVAFVVNNCACACGERRHRKAGSGKLGNAISVLPALEFDSMRSEP
jgi:hypothetical protein